MLRNTATTYGLVTKFLHWTIFLLFVGAFTTILAVEDMPDGPLKFTLYNIHKSCGVTAFILMIVRVLWRFMSPPPQDLPAKFPLENTAAKGVHYGLYLCLIFVPLAGLLFNKYPINYFLMFEIQPVFDLEKEIAKPIKEMHEILGWTALCLVGLHILAALFHEFVRKDKGLRRML